jgi:hypothetical protein
MKAQTYRKSDNRLLSSLLGILTILVGSGDLQSASIEGKYGYAQGTAAQVTCSAPQAADNISGSGTPFALTDDAESNVVLPFAFDFYGTTYNNIVLANNGGVLLATDSSVSELTPFNQDLPTADITLPAILPFWDDLDDERGAVYTQTKSFAPFREFHIQWDRPHFSNTGDATIKLVLFESTSSIHFNYPDIDFGNADFTDGASATVGIQKDSSEAMITSFNSSISTALNGAFNECFEPRRVQYEFSLGQDPICERPSYEGDITIEEGDSAFLCVYVYNSTNQNFETSRVQLTPGFDTTESATLAANSSETLMFELTPDSDTHYVFQVDWWNPAPEGDFTGNISFSVKVSSVLDFLPAIISGAAKKQ